MSNQGKRCFIGWILVSLLTMASVASASGLHPYWRPKHPRHPAPPTGVAEPAAIALLGMGLVTLGIYAKKKRGKKQ